MTLQYEVRTRYGSPETFEDAWDAASHITDNEEYIDELEVDVDEYIDEAYGHIEINGTDYWASRILYNLDEEAYYDLQREEKRSSAENNTDCIADQIRSMDEGDELNYDGGITVTCIAVMDEEDEEEDSSFDEEFGSIFEYSA